MLRRDYILEMLEQLAHEIARIVFMRDTGRYDEAYKQIDDSCRQFFGLDAPTVRMLGSQALVQMLAPNGGRELEKCVVAADLLRELGALYIARELYDDGYDCLVRAMDLYLHACTNPETFASLDMGFRFDATFGLLGEWELPDDLNYRLIDLHNEQGSYAAAEDLLFEMIDRDAEGGVERGIAFYRSLLEKPDDELLRGRLPREEVEESLAELLKRLTSDSNRG
jgi:hypothetical protein